MLHVGEAERGMSSDAMRAYVVTLRKGRGVSQDDLARKIGMAPRTYLAWETGEIKDIKAPFLMRAISTLRGIPAHLMRLSEEDQDVEHGEALAQAVLRGLEAGGGLDYVQTPEDVEELVRYFEEELTALEEEDRKRAGERLKGFWAGLRFGRRRNGD